MLLILLTFQFSENAFNRSSSRWHAINDPTPPPHKVDYDADGFNLSDLSVGVATLFKCLVYLKGRVRQALDRLDLVVEGNTCNFSLLTAIPEEWKLMDEDRLSAKSSEISEIFLEFMRGFDWAGIWLPRKADLDMFLFLLLEVVVAVWNVIGSIIILDYYTLNILKLTVFSVENNRNYLIQAFNLHTKTKI